MCSWIFPLEWLWTAREINFNLNLRQAEENPIQAYLNPLTVFNRWNVKGICSVRVAMSTTRAVLGGGGAFYALPPQVFREYLKNGDATRSAIQGQVTR